MNESGQNFRRRLRICFLFWQRTVQINFSSCGQSALSWAVCYFTVFLLSRSAKLICYNCRIKNEAHDNGLSKAPCVPYYEEYQTAKISIICSEPPKADDGDPAGRLAGELYDGNNPCGNGFWRSALPAFFRYETEDSAPSTMLFTATAKFRQKKKISWSVNIQCSTLYISSKLSSLFHFPAHPQSFEYIFHRLSLFILNFYPVTVTPFWLIHLQTRLHREMNIAATRATSTVAECWYHD